MTTRLLCDTCRNTHIQTSQKALISCRRHALHNARDPKEHKPHTKMVKQTRALSQTLTLRKLLGHFMSTLPRLHAYDTPCRDMFPESFKNECQHTHAHQNTGQAESKHNPTVLERLFVAALKVLTFIGVVFLSLGFQQHLNQALVPLISFKVC